jgi:hypothetical protein
LGAEVVAVSGSDSSDYRDQQPHCGLHGDHSQQFLARRKQVHQGEGGEQSIGVLL